MGFSFALSWFGKSVEELKAILETENLTDEEKRELKRLIEKKENEQSK